VVLRSFGADLLERDELGGNMGAERVVAGNVTGQA